MARGLAYPFPVRMVLSKELSQSFLDPMIGFKGLLLHPFHLVITHC